MTPEDQLFLEWCKIGIAIITAITTAVAAWFAIRIANRQSKTAERKLNFELYNRRFDIYHSAYKMLRGIATLSSAKKMKLLIEGFREKYTERHFMLEKIQIDYLEEAYVMGNIYWQHRKTTDGLLQKYRKQAFEQKVQIYQLMNGDESQAFHDASLTVNQIEDGVDKFMERLPEVFMPVLNIQKAQL